MERIKVLHAEIKLFHRLKYWYRLLAFSFGWTASPCYTNLRLSGNGSVKYVSVQLTPFRALYSFAIYATLRGLVGHFGVWEASACLSNLYVWCAFQHLWSSLSYDMIIGSIRLPCLSFLLIWISFLGWGSSSLIWIFYIYVFFHVYFIHSAHCFYNSLMLNFSGVLAQFACFLVWVPCLWWYSWFSYDEPMRLIQRLIMHEWC